MAGGGLVLILLLACLVCCCIRRRRRRRRGRNGGPRSQNAQQGGATTASFDRKKRAGRNVPPASAGGGGFGDNGGGSGGPRPPASKGRWFGREKGRKGGGNLSSPGDQSDSDGRAECGGYGGGYGGGSASANQINIEMQSVTQHPTPTTSGSTSRPATSSPPSARVESTAAVQLASVLNCDQAQAQRALDAAGGDPNAATEHILLTGIIAPRSQPRPAVPPPPPPPAPAAFETNFAAFGSDEPAFGAAFGDDPAPFESPGFSSQSSEQAYAVHGFGAAYGDISPLEIDAGSTTAQGFDSPQHGFDGQTAHFGAAAGVSAFNGYQDGPPHDEYGQPPHSYYNQGYPQAEASVYTYAEDPFASAFGTPALPADPSSAAPPGSMASSVYDSARVAPGDVRGPAESASFGSAIGEDAFGDGGFRSSAVSDHAAGDSVGFAPSPPAATFAPSEGYTGAEPFLMHETMFSGAVDPMPPAAAPMDDTMFSGAVDPMPPAAAPMDDTMFSGAVDPMPPPAPMNEDMWSTAADSRPSRGAWGGAIDPLPGRGSGGSSAWGAVIDPMASAAPGGCAPPDGLTRSSSVSAGEWWSVTPVAPAPPAPPPAAEEWWEGGGADAAETGTSQAGSSALQRARANRGRMAPTPQRAVPATLAVTPAAPPVPPAVGEAAAGDWWEADAAPSAPPAVGEAAAGEWWEADAGASLDV